MSAPIILLPTHSLVRLDGLLRGAFFLFEQALFRKTGLRSLILGELSGSDIVDGNNTKKGIVVTRQDNGSFLGLAPEAMVKVVEIQLVEFKDE